MSVGLSTWSPFPTNIFCVRWHTGQWVVAFILPGLCAFVPFRSKGGHFCIDFIMKNITKKTFFSSTLEFEVEELWEKRLNAAKTEAGLMVTVYIYTVIKYIHQNSTIIDLIPYILHWFNNSHQIPSVDIYICTLSWISTLRFIFICNVCALPISLAQTATWM